MNEEKFGKSVRTPYIVTYSIAIFLGLFLIGIGVISLLLISGKSSYFAIYWILLGCVLLGSGIGWLIYFILLPEYSITYKAGKLYFRNKLECTPDRMEYIESKKWGLDSAIFNYGRVIVTVGGKKYKINFVYNAQDAVNRLYAIRNEYVAALNAAYSAAQAQAAQAQAGETSEKAEEAPAEAPATEAPAPAEAVDVEAGKEENNG